MVPQVSPASANWSAGQLADAPLQRSATSQAEALARQTWLDPSVVHWPSWLAPSDDAHASHTPAHAALQHTPSVQNPEMHSPGAAQVTPLFFFAEQYMPLQYVFEEQPEVHKMGQSASDPLHTTEPPHAGSPGSFTGLGRHSPRCPARLQRSQLWLQAFAQHTPSAQNPDAHWPAESQGAPAGCRGSHPASTQKRPVAHWRGLLQLVGQAPCNPSHAKLPQLGAWVPTLSKPHDPSVQVSHGPLQALEQHWWSTQKPEAHSVLPPHVDPFALSGAQSPAAQPVPEAHATHDRPVAPHASLLVPSWHWR